MKIKIFYIRFVILPLILLTALNTAVNSQGTDSRKTYVGKDKLYLGITFSPQKTYISNEKFFASNALNYKKGTSFNFALDGGYFFSKIAGISIGAGFGTYSTKLSMDSCSINFQTVDSENETYEMRIKGESISEDQKLSFLSIPVCLTLRFPCR